MTLATSNKASGRHTSSLGHCNRNAGVNHSLPLGGNDCLLRTVQIVPRSESRTPGGGLRRAHQLLDEQRRQRLLDRGHGRGGRDSHGVGLGAFRERGGGEGGGFASSSRNGVGGRGGLFGHGQKKNENSNWAERKERKGLIKTGPHRITVWFAVSFSQSLACGAGRGARSGGER